MPLRKPGSLTMTGMATAFGTPLQGAGLNPNGSQTLFLNGGAYQVEIAADNSESVTRYYSQASQRLAMRNLDGSIDYLLDDHLGSVSAVVNTAGEVVSQSRYLPFGELLWNDGESPTDYSYTGQRSLSDLGLMDYNARFYDPLLGRFIQPDSMVAGLIFRKSDSTHCGLP
jgi:RHS repeat-associated protein